MTDDNDTLLHDVEHLEGALLPALILSATNGQNVQCGNLKGWNVLYFYPRTSPPNGAPLKGWDAIPGARGCTPQSRGFRDHYQELIAAGAKEVFGVSVQETNYQREVVGRLRLPFRLISDPRLLFQQKLGMPVFKAGDLTLYRRVTLVIFGTEIRKVFDPVLDPAANAGDVLAYLTTQRNE